MITNIAKQKQKEKSTHFDWTVQGSFLSKHNTTFMTGTASFDAVNYFLETVRQFKLLHFFLLMFLLLLFLVVFIAEPLTFAQMRFDQDKTI